MIIDTHAHLQFRAYDKDREEVIKRCLDGSTSSPQVWTINVGTNYETSKAAVGLAEKYDNGVYAAVGLHPINLDTGLVKMRTDANEGGHSEKEFDYEKYKELAKSPKVAAIGEIGLDYYWKPKTKARLEQFKQKQKDLLALQFKLARELDLPIIFHCRMAHDDLLDILDQKIRGVIHSFTGNLQQAKKFLEIGLYLGFNAIIFKKIEGIDFEDVIKNTPLDRILLETDCPYLTPPKEQGRNEPPYIEHLARRVSELKDTSYEELVKRTADNAGNLFNI